MDEQLLLLHAPIERILLKLFLFLLLFFFIEFLPLPVVGHAELEGIIKRYRLVLAICRFILFILLV